jgi:hypothetical protein
VGRHSYRKLIRLPAWRLVDADGRCVASVRAPGPEQARLLFVTSLTENELRRGCRIVRESLWRGVGDASAGR